MFQENTSSGKMASIKQFTSTDPQIRVCNKKLFFLYLNYVVGTQKNRLNEH